MALLAIAGTIGACGGSNGSREAPDGSFPDTGGVIKLPPKLDAGAHDVTTRPAADAHEASSPTSADASDDADDADAETLDADTVPDGPFTAAAHSLPIIPDNGGPVLSHPLLVTVTYANDPRRAFVEGLGKYLVTSSWLSMVGPEYGIGLGTAANVELPGNAPDTIDDVGIQALVESLVKSGTAPDPDASVIVTELPPESDAGFGDAGDAGPDAPPFWDGGGDSGPPVPMPQAIYMMYFPSTTAISADSEAICSFSGGGYHFQTSLTSDGQSYAYGVVTECPMSTEEDLVQTASHEFIEASTDPGSVDRAYSIEDQLDPWSYFGGEVGDLCSLLAPQWSEGSYNGIQRVYSDKSAAAGGDPCLPAPEPYYGTTLIPSTAVAVGAGDIATFSVTGWSSAATSDWYIEGEAYISSPTTFTPTFALAGAGCQENACTMNNGGTATLTVGVPVGTPSGSYALGILYAAKSESDYTSSLIEVYVP